MEVSEFRKSCLRHHWPPDADMESDEIDLERIRQQLICGEHELIISVLSNDEISKVEKKEKKKPASKPDWQDVLPKDKDIIATALPLERLTMVSPDSLDGEMYDKYSVLSDGTGVTTKTSSSSESKGSDQTDVTCKTDKTYVLALPCGKPSTPKRSQQRPTSAGKRDVRRPLSGGAIRKPTDSPRRAPPKQRSGPSSPKKTVEKADEQKEFRLHPKDENDPMERPPTPKRHVEVIIPTNGQTESGSDEDLSKASRTPSVTSLSSLGDTIKENDESPAVEPPTIAPGGTAMFVALDSPKKTPIKRVGNRPTSAKGQRPISGQRGLKSEKSRLPVMGGSTTPRH